VPSFLYATGLQADVEGIGALTIDVAYGGNFYAIVEPQANFRGLEHVHPNALLTHSPRVRAAFAAQRHFVHPERPQISGLSHVMWTGKPLRPGSTARNAVFYGERAIDRSPCGTGTAARMAQWSARGKLRAGDAFVHESIIGSQFTGRIEQRTRVGDLEAIVPSIQGWARITGFNTLFVDDRDPYWRGFQLGGLPTPPG